MTVDKISYESVPQKEKHEEIPELPIQKLPKGWGARHTQSLLLFISLTVGLTIRAHLSMSIVAMTSNSTLQMWYPNISTSCLYPSNNSEWNYNNTYKEGEKNESVEDEVCRRMKEDFDGWNVYRVYAWDKPIQEMILFAFFVGYTTAMIPMGIIAHKYGAKITILVALGVNGVLSILTPWIPIFAGWLGVCVCRLLQGLTQACMYPSVHSMLGMWAPTNERGRLGAYIYTGSQFGTILAFQIAGYFAGSPALGWPSTFWFFGILCLITFGLMAWLGASSPYEHATISSEEFTYICEGNGNESNSKERLTPWKQILTCPSVWGIIAAQIGSSLGYLFVFTEIPLYMNKILNVDIKDNGLFSSLPYIAMYATCILFGNMADWFANKNMMSLVNIRRLFNTIGMVVSSIFLVAFCCVQNTLLAIILLITYLALFSGGHAGFLINGIDLAPNYAGLIMTVGNMLASLSSLAIPFMVSNIVGNDTTNQFKWQILFLCIAAVQIITNIVYVVFAKGTVQPWNFQDKHDDVEIKNSTTVKEKK